MSFSCHHRLGALHRIQELSEDCLAVALEQGIGCQSCCVFLLLLNAYYLCVVVSWYYHARVLQILCLITGRAYSLMFLEASSLISGCLRGTGFQGSGSVLASPSLWCTQHSLAMSAWLHYRPLSSSGFSPVSVSRGPFIFTCRCQALDLNIGKHYTKTADFKLPHHKEMKLWLCYSACLIFFMSGTLTETSSHIP